MRNTLQRALTAVSLTLLTLQASIGSAADLLVSGTIYTANDEAPMVEAVIIRDGRFNYVGTLEVQRCALAIRHGVRRGAGRRMPGRFGHPPWRCS